MKIRHEVRDGIHGFIEFNNRERDLINSAPFQRLRDISQLALTYHVYPGATHKRFEHCLGVMEIASRIFDRLFDSGPLADEIRERLMGFEEEKVTYWKGAVRAAALLHDVGHLPFSHGAEEELLPDGWDHERMTAVMIRESEIAQILTRHKPPIDPEDVVNLCWEISKRSKVEMDYSPPSIWVTILNEAITGNTFGADRIDYLLRDSHHAGVAYGRFDPDRLISGLRLVIDNVTNDIVIGMDYGAIHAAEALLLARYFMYTQVYFHDVRRVYDRQLVQYLQALVPGGRFPTEWVEFLKWTDNEVLVDMREAYLDDEHPRHQLALKIMGRQHFKTAYELVLAHKQKRPDVLGHIAEKLSHQFGEANVLTDEYSPKQKSEDFPVMTESGDLRRSIEVSDVIKNIPPTEFGYVFVSPELHDEAKAIADEAIQGIMGTA